MKICAICKCDLSYIYGYKKYCSNCRILVEKRNIEKRKAYYEKVRNARITRWDRYFIRKKFGNKCWHCGISGCRLEIHHVNYESNPIVKLLCKSCHSLEHTRMTNNKKFHPEHVLENKMKVRS